MFLARVSLCCILLLSATAMPALAGDFAIDRFLLKVPTGFEGPLSARPDQRSETHAFTARGSSSLNGAVLQITVRHMDETPTIPDQRSSTEIAERVLEQMLLGIEARRTDFRKSQAEKIYLGGALGMRVLWSGNANGVATNGVMYCLVSGNVAILLHVMGASTIQTPVMKEAMKAVEQLRER